MNPQNRTSARASLLATLVSPLLLTSSAHAQLPCGAPAVGGGAYTTEVWVDPINGNDATAAPNNPALPFFTIQAAMQVTAGGGQNNRSLVHLNPGVYSAVTNGETFPVSMQDWTDLQGVGAKQVILRGDQQQTLLQPFYPMANNCQCGIRPNREILVDYSSTANPQYAEMLDGVTLQGGHIQVYAETGLGAIDGRVSNCIFDMLNNAVTDLNGNPVPGPDFGVLVVQTYQNPGYPAARMHVLNNTFVQSWVPNIGQVFGTVNGSVAICNVTDPACPSGPAADPNRTLRGLGTLNIQNNLIRSLGTSPATAMLGIDNGDVSCAIGTQIGPTNAFDPLAVGGNNTLYCSQITGASPLPRLNPNPATGGVDPAFVGEFLSNLGLPVVFARDWRLLPDSVYADQGSGPLATGAGLVLGATNGTRHTDLACTPSSSYDFDGEHYGNLRIAPSPIAATTSVPQPDIGYDEVSMLIDCGMVNDTIVHTPAIVPFLGNTIPGLGTHILLYPSAGPGTVADQHLVAVNPILLPPLTTYSAYSAFPGTALPAINGTVLGIPLAVPFNWLWLPLTFAVPGVPPLTRFTFASPFDGTPHALSFCFMPSVGGGVGSYFPVQSLYVPGGGPNAGQNILTNVQASFD